MFDNFDTTICAEEFYEEYLNWKAMKDFYEEEEKEEKGWIKPLFFIGMFNAADEFIVIIS